MRLLIDARYVRVGFHDGISRYTASLLQALYDLKQKDHPLTHDIDIVMAVSEDGQLQTLPPFPHLRLHSPTGVLEPFSALILNRYRPDIVFSPMQTMGSWGRKFKLVLTLHDLIYYSYPQPPSFLPLPVQWGWRLFHQTYSPQRFLLNGADAVTTVSHTTAALIRTHRLTRRPLWIIPNAPQQVETGTPLPQSQRTKKLIYMGSFMPYKNVETLLQAMHELPEYELHLLSKIPAARQTELEPLTAPNTHFHHGVTDAEYRQLLHDSFALLTASKAEGYGLPVVEAQSAGCPVVISDIEIFQEIAPHSLRFDTDNPYGLVKKIRELENPDTYASIQKLGRLDAAQYSWEESALKLLGHLKNV